MSDQDLDTALAMVRQEYANARRKHAPMHSGHEGYAVILEELDELWELVRVDRSNTVDAYHEAMQVAAMAVAFMVEVAT